MPKKQVGVSRISIRFAKPNDGLRFEAEGLVSGHLPAGESWPERIAKWRIEQDAGRRSILIAEDAGGLLGMVHLIFSFPPGYADAEAANGHDVAMIESLRARANAPAQVLDHLVADAQTVAKRHHVTTVTLCLPLENDRAIQQAKSWGFTEFRRMPDAHQILAFFRKSIA
jgi:hypothetical protein